MHQRNPSYSGGGDPWSPDEEATAFVRGAQRLINNDRVAKQYKAPWLRTTGVDDVWVAVDRATTGRRIAKIGIRRGDEVFIVFSILTRGRNALTLAVRVAKG